MIPLGARVPIYGKVSAVGIISGERYYWLIADNGTVSMMPACMIEGQGQLKESRVEAATEAQ